MTADIQIGFIYKGGLLRYNFHFREPFIDPETGKNKYVHFQATYSELKGVPKHFFEITKAKSLKTVGNINSRKRVTVNQKFYNLKKFEHRFPEKKELIQRRLKKLEELIGRFIDEYNDIPKNLTELRKFEANEKSKHYIPLSRVVNEIYTKQFELHEKHKNSIKGTNKSSMSLSYSRLNEYKRILSITKRYESSNPNGRNILNLPSDFQTLYFDSIVLTSLNPEPYVIRKEISPNTVVKLLKTFNAIMRQAFDSKLYTAVTPIQLKSSYSSTRKLDAEIVFDMTDIQQMFKVAFKSNKVKGWLHIGVLLFSGVRISDLETLLNAPLKKTTNGNGYYEVKQKKKESSSKVGTVVQPTLIPSFFIEKFIGALNFNYSTKVTNTVTPNNKKLIADFFQNYGSGLSGVSLRAFNSKSLITINKNVFQGFAGSKSYKLIKKSTTINKYDHFGSHTLRKNYRLILETIMPENNEVIETLMGHELRSLGGAAKSYYQTSINSQHAFVDMVTEKFKASQVAQNYKKMIDAYLK